MESKAAKQTVAINPWMSNAHPFVQSLSLTVGAAVVGAGFWYLGAWAGGGFDNSNFKDVTPSTSATSEVDRPSAFKLQWPSTKPATAVRQQPSPDAALESLQHMLVAFGGVMGAVGVGAGAFGFHGLRRVLGSKVTNPDELLRFWDIAKNYQLLHSIALVALPALPPEAAVPAGTAFASGILLFSHSIFAYVLTREPVFQYATPLGGTLFMVGWVVIAAVMGSRALQARQSHDDQSGEPTGADSR